MFPQIDLRRKEGKRPQLVPHGRAARATGPKDPAFPPDSDRGREIDLSDRLTNDVDLAHSAESWNEGDECQRALHYINNTIFNYLLTIIYKIHKFDRKQPLSSTGCAQKLSETAQRTNPPEARGISSQPVGCRGAKCGINQPRSRIPDEVGFGMDSIIRRSGRRVTRVGESRQELGPNVPDDRILDHLPTGADGARASKTLREPKIALSERWRAVRPLSGLPRVHRSQDLEVRPSGRLSGLRGVGRRRRVPLSQRRRTVVTAPSSPGGQSMRPAWSTPRPFPAVPAKPRWSLRWPQITQSAGPAQPPGSGRTRYLQGLDRPGRVLKSLDAHSPWQTGGVPGRNGLGVDRVRGGWGLILEMNPQPPPRSNAPDRTVSHRLDSAPRRLRALGGGGDGRPRGLDGLGVRHAPIRHGMRVRTMVMRRGLRFFECRGFAGASDGSGRFVELALGTPARRFALRDGRRLRAGDREEKTRTARNR